MIIKTNLALTVLLICHIGIEPNSHQGVYGDQPSASWQYTRNVTLSNTPSERVEGVLLKNGKQVHGKPGQIIDTPKGRFICFGNKDRFFENKNLAKYRGWLNQDTENFDMFESTGKLKDKYYPLPLPFKLVNLPDDKAPETLRDVKTWESERDASFGVEKYRYLSFDHYNLVTRFSKNVPYSRDLDSIKRGPANYSPKSTYHYFATSTILSGAGLYKGDSYSTYLLDSSNRVLVVGAAIPIGSKKWFYSSGSLSNSSTERQEVLYEFDQNPTTTKEGQVKVSYYQSRKSKTVTSVSTIYQVKKQIQPDHIRWNIHIDFSQQDPNITSTFHELNLIFYKFENGLEYCELYSSNATLYRPE